MKNRKRKTFRCLLSYNLLKKKESEYKNMIISLVDKKNKVKTGQPIKKLLSVIYFKTKTTSYKTDIKTKLKAKRTRYYVMYYRLCYKFDIGNIDILAQKSIEKR